jgi:RNA polymerase sigma-70 factor (family 1)
MTPGAQLTDTELWEAIKLDNQKAFDMLFDKYWSCMYTTAYNYLRDGEISAEIVHDVFLNIWQKRKEFQINSLKNYLTSATRYHVYKCLRERKTSSIVYIENYNDSIYTKHENEGEERLMSLDLESSMNNQLYQLPKRCREIFLLSRIQQMNNDEIATHLGISKRTVENQITHALKFLRLHFKSMAMLLLIFIFR